MCFQWLSVVTFAMVSNHQPLCTIVSINLCYNFLIPFGCTFNSSYPWWSNTPLPNTNSSVHFFGTVANVKSAGTIHIDI